ncbi:MAG: HAMP domain-containing histidine kinase [Hyphomonadaceae bacterium]|nr:HAMP domain-containing histidine kinase [Hyphomonadaceae bacterium]
MSMVSAPPPFANAEFDGHIRTAREHSLRELMRLPVNLIVSGFLFAFVGPREAATWLAVVFAVEAVTVYSRRRVAAGDLRFRTTHLGCLFALSLCWVAHALMLWQVGSEVPRIAAIMDLFTIALYGAIGGHRDWRLMLALLAAPLVTLFSILAHLLWTTTAWPVAAMATVATLGACATIVANGFAMHRSERQTRAAVAALDAERAALEIRVRERTVALSAALAQANAANIAKSQFLATMSHELRTPLNAVIGYAELLGDELRAKAPPPGPADADRIAAAAQSLLGLVNDILDYSKLETGAMTLDVTPVDVRSLLESACSEVTERARASGNMISMSVAPDIDRAFTDAERLRQCVTHLVDNACKFTKNGAVRITATTAGDSMLEITVADTGPGVPPELHARIFEPFVQGDGSATRTHPGVGLGLAMTRKLANLLGGDLVLRRDVSVGAAFTLRIPMRAPRTA